MHRATLPCKYLPVIVLLITFAKNIKGENFNYTLSMNLKTVFILGMNQRGRAPQLLLTSCPNGSRSRKVFLWKQVLPNSFVRCVSRNFCDNTGVISRKKINKLRFSQDDRGLVVRLEHYLLLINWRVMFLELCGY